MVVNLFCHRAVTRGKINANRHQDALALREKTLEFRRRVLPENDPEATLAQFARMARETRILDKDLVSIDLRVPGRIYARLTEEAAAARAEAMPRSKRRGAPT